MVCKHTQMDADTDRIIAMLWIVLIGMAMSHVI